MVERLKPKASRKGILGNNIESYTGEFRELGPTRRIADLLGMNFGGDRGLAANLLDSMGLIEKEKVDFFRYFLWQQFGASGLKELGDTRTESMVSLWGRIHKDERAEVYGIFYSAYQKEKAISALMRGETIESVSGEFEIKSGQTGRIKKVLIFEGKVQPNVGRRKQTEDFISFCLGVKVLRQSSPELTREEMRQVLNCSESRLDEALYLLRLADAIPKNRKKRKIKDIDDEAEIIRIRNGTEDLSQHQIATIMRIPRHRVAYYISKAIREGKIPRESTSPKKRVKPQ